MKDQLKNLIRAGYSGLYLVTHEEVRAEAEVKAVADNLKFKLASWAIGDGLLNLSTNPPTQIAGTEDPMSMLDALAQLPEKSIILAKDLHMLLEQPDPVLVRKIKNALLLGKATNRVLIICGCQLKLPVELEKWLTVVEFQLPTEEELKVVLENVAQSASIELNGNTQQVLRAASGLTTNEAEDAFAYSVVKDKEILPETVAKIKAETVKKNGILEVVETMVTLEDIGGLEYIKADLWAKRNLFTKEAKEYGLPTPRPLLCVGQAGTGKSLASAATKNIFGIPLLKLEAGRIFASHVGESEGNWRSAFSTAKAIAPCILWVDELDGLMGGAESSGKTDGGTTLRVIKAILQDIQFNSEGVFFMFTANDIDGLPDPLIDRCDVWGFDLPTKSERKEILAVHIRKRGRKPKNFDLDQMSDLTSGYSGRQIEQLWLKAMTLAFNDGGREPSMKDVVAAAKLFVPTSVTMAEAIERRRKRLQNRAQPASKPDSEQPKARKLAGE